MHPSLLKLKAYPFERLKDALADMSPPRNTTHLSFSIGEPKHRFPSLLKQVLNDSIHGFNYYPSIKGTEYFRQAAADWLITRYGLDSNAIDIDSNILPINGSREGLFAFTQFRIDPTKDPLIVTSNPFYQIYEGAAIIAGARIKFINSVAANNFSPDFSRISENEWRQCQILHLCSPNNPTGTVLSTEQITIAIELALKHDFTIVSDECYSEIYLDEDFPPPGLLEVCKKIGNDKFKNCIVFHSLSKRSNVPGLRSGIVTGDAELITQFLRFRTYHGSSMSPTVQMISEALWQDETHVLENRTHYRNKFSAVIEILKPIMSFPDPKASFYLWPKTPIDDIAMTRDLYSKQNLTVLPGQFMSRHSDGTNPGRNRLRLALVAPVAECREGANRIASYIKEL